MRQSGLASESNKRVAGKINLADVDRFMVAAKFVDVNRLGERANTIVNTDKSLLRF